MSTSAYVCLSLERALDYVGDMEGVSALLGTLQQSLQGDLPKLQAHLAQGDLSGTHRVLHQFKGFAPVFCTPALVAEVVRVEALSKTADLAAVREACARLLPQLQLLLQEAQTQLARPR